MAHIYSVVLVRNRFTTKKGYRVGSVYQTDNLKQARREAAWLNRVIRVPGVKHAVSPVSNLPIVF